MRIEEEGKLRREIVDRESGVDCRLDVGASICQGEGYFLNVRGTGFADVVARNRNRIPVGKLLAAPRKNIGDDAHGRAKRIDVSAASDVLLENVVLDSAGETLKICALLFGDCDVEGEKNRGGGIDGHRGGDVLERDAVEERLHVFEGVDGDADFADFTLRERVVGIHADLGGEIEGDGEPVNALRQEV